MQQFCVYLQPFSLSMHKKTWPADVICELEMHKCLMLGLCPGPHWGSLQCFTISLGCFHPLLNFNPARGSWINGWQKHRREVELEPPLQRSGYRPGSVKLADPRMTDGTEKCWDAAWGPRVMVQKWCPTKGHSIGWQFDTVDRECPYADGSTAQGISCRLAQCLHSCMTTYLNLLIKNRLDR